MLSVALLVFLVACSAFFSGSETALTAVSRARLFAMIQSGVRRAALVNRLREKKDMLIGTLLLGNTFVNIATASLATVILVRLFGPEYGPVIATVATTLIVLIFAEVLPKTIAIYHAERVALWVAWPLHLIIRLLSPITWLVQQVVRGILWVFGVTLNDSHSLHTATDAIRGTIEMHHSDGEVDREDRDMLGSILDLSQREISEVMVHRKQVETIDLSEEPEEIVNHVIASTYSRIPLWRDNPDNIVGVLHVRDVLRLLREQKIGLTREMIRRAAKKPWFVPETTAMDEQLTAFRTKRKHFACVVDEYGAWQGIVTLEDIIEEIVGEIDDEHDPLEIADVMPFGPHAYRVAGTVTIRDLNRQLDWNLPDTHATTLAGLVMHEARVIPEIGAVFEFFGYRFTIIDRKHNQITTMTLERLPDGFDDAQE